MQIIYLKKTHDAKAGDIRNIRDHDARALIAIGVVKKYIDEQSEKVEKVIKNTAKKSKKKKED